MTATTLPTSSADEPWVGLCETDPDMWDLDASAPVEWMRALQACTACPVLEMCRKLRLQHYPTSERLGGYGPAGTIWAGAAYGDTGAVLTTATFRRLARQVGNRQSRHSSPAPGHRAAA